METFSLGPRVKWGVERNPPTQSSPMRIRPTLTAVATTTLFSLTLGAQAPDTARRWSLFGGAVGAHATDLERPPANLEVGGSGDFRLGSFPLPLRATLAFSRIEQSWSASNLKYGTLSLDAVGRPTPRIFGTQLYFLGGIGVATQAGYTGFAQRYVSVDPVMTEYYMFSVPRQSWTFLEGGMGLEIGRAFVQMKMQVPVASNGPTRVPLSVGFRF